MGKFRSKLKGKSKGKRWPKGQSSSSNPDTRKYRDRAKSRFFQENLGPSNLTSDALRRHDAGQTRVPAASKAAQSVEMDDESQSGVSGSSYRTMHSFASEWSDCTNMSFSKFLKMFRAESSLHKEMLAVLAAITEVIKENGGSETPVEYYCSLLTTLDQLLEADEKNVEQITAVLSLLNMGMKSVPEGVLRTSFNEFSLKLLHVLSEFSEADNNSVVKSVIGILTTLLRAQEAALWGHSTTTQVFLAILNPFSIHTKPKWRKAAQQAAALVVRASCFSNKNSANPAAECVSDFCEKTLNTCMGGNSGTVLVSSVQAGQTTILHTLNLMKDTICFFPKSHLKKCCEIILRLMTLNYPIVTATGLQVLHSLFSSQTAVVSAKLNAQLISALYEYQPALNDVQPTLAWLAVVQQAHVHLADVDLVLSCAALPKIFAVATQLWLSQKTEVATAATHALDILLKDAVSPACESPQLVEQHGAKLSKCFGAIELGLGYQFHAVWHQVLYVIGIMFDVAGTNCKQFMMSCLKSLAELRDSYKFSYNNELEHAVGAAVRSMGPETVLGVIDLKKPNGELNLDRSWLLPVLKENVRQSTLSHWVNNILPMAIFCQRRSVELSEKNDGIGAHSSELLYVQLWNLLHSFCNNPTDIKDSFKSIAKVLGTAISERKELRLVVMASLRKLIVSAKENENSDDLSEISRFDKNYLPILFNVYTTRPIGTDEEGQRLAALETIKVYLTVAKPELTKQLFGNALDKLNESKEADGNFTKESVMDLVRALVPYQDCESVERLYRECVANLPELKNNREQKKAYRLLEEICGSSAEGCREFMKNNRKDVQRLLRKSLESAAVSSKGARLRCLKYLLQAQPHLDHESKFIRSIIPEAVLCCKDINEKCRASAYELLKVVGEILSRHNQMNEFVAMLVAGLGGTAQMMTNTILALASTLHHFSGALGADNIQIVLDNVLTLMTSPTREVAGACLSFVKVYFGCLPSPVVAAALPALVKGLTQMTEDCKRHFRLKVRDVLDRLVRKFGCDSITPHVPATDTVMYKRLRNLRKLNARKKKRKEAQQQEDEEELSGDEEFIVNSKAKSMEEILADSDSEFEDMEVDQPKRVKSKKSNAWIEEDPETIVDFTDPSAVSKITATKPGQAGPSQVPEKKNTKDRGFKTAPDGRLIIADDGDDDSDDDAKKKQKKGFVGFGSDSESDDDDQSAAETLVLTNRKRKRSESGSVKSGFSGTSQMKYKTGGVGIHRSVKSTASSVYSGVGSDYKSKNASGDVKKKGKPDPYAYLPLRRSALNKRKKMKVAGQFKNIIKGAQSGTLKGAKAKRNRNKK